MSNDEISTVEAAERLSVKASTLRYWQRAGWLTPRSEGAGNGRRLFWCERDLQDARDLQNDESRKTKTDAFVDSLGGDRIITIRDRALESLDASRPGDLAIVTASTYRIVRGDDLVALGKVMHELGGCAIIMQA